MKDNLQRFRNRLTLALAFNILIVLQLFVGVLMVMFFNAWLGLLLFGNAALIHLSREALRQLFSLRELLTYALFKQEKASEVRPREPESVSHPGPTVATHGD